jgi:DNA (cytosine-5)-methyltransferase 1
MAAYYNERDLFAAQWLRNLMTAGLIAPGHVDDRSIEEVRADDLQGFTQCHFFAGIAGWSLALRQAGWPDDRPVWTGSCPCQPFSAAGKGKAADDERHLWPCWFSLIRECKPSIVFGEQVEAAIGWGWLDVVFSDLEAEGYACGAAVLPACGVGAPHIRNRLWFVADAVQPAGQRRPGGLPGAQAPLGSARQFDGHQPDGLGHGGKAGELGDASRNAERRPRLPEACHERQSEAGGSSSRLRLMGDAFCAGLEGRQSQHRNDGPQCPPAERTGDQSGPLVHAPREQMGLPGRPRLPGNANPWSDLQWLPCTDGKARPTKPGLFPLAHGVPARVGKLRAAGNAIVPQVAAEFIRSAM